MQVEGNVGQSSTLISTEISQQLLDGFPWHFVDIHAPQRINQEVKFVQYFGVWPNTFGLTCTFYNNHGLSFSLVSAVTN